jgi:hypothetical protein
MFFQFLYKTFDNNYEPTIYNSILKLYIYVFRYKKNRVVY